MYRRVVRVAPNDGPVAASGVGVGVRRVGSAVMRNPFASALWSNQAFVRVWSAATISIFGSLVTRIALPLAAILVLGSGAIEVAILRSLDLVATLVFGLVAGAWVDRLRRRPVLIWADLGRAALLGSIPLAFALGVLTFWQLLIVSGLAAVLTTFFDSADNAYLPTIVERDQLVPANSALAASGSAAEFMAFGISGFLVQALTAPIAILLDAISYLVSAVLLATIRREEAPPPPREDREPVLAEIREGLRLVRHDPILRAFAGAQMALAGVVGRLRRHVLPVRAGRPAVESGRAGPRGRRGRCLVVHRRRHRDPCHEALGHRPCGDRRDAPVGGGQRVHPAGAGRPAPRRDRLPGHAAARRRLGRDRLRRDRGVGPPDARPRPGARSGDVDVPRRGRHRPARGDARRPGCWPRSSGFGRRPGSRRSAACSARRSCSGRRSGRCTSSRSSDDRSPAEIVVDVERDQPVGG